MSVILSNAYIAPQNDAGAIIKPEMFRLPKPGQRDPYFGLPFVLEPEGGASKKDT